MTLLGTPQAEDTADALISCVPICRKGLAVERRVRISSLKCPGILSSSRTTAASPSTTHRKLALINGEVASMITGHAGVPISALCLHVLDTATAVVTPLTRGPGIIVFMSSV